MQSYYREIVIVFLMIFSSLPLFAVGLDTLKEMTVRPTAISMVIIAWFGP
jgi:hypothetical protein